MSVKMCGVSEQAGLGNHQWPMNEIGWFVDPDIRLPGFSSRSLDSIVKEAFAVWEEISDVRFFQATRRANTNFMIVAKNIDGQNGVLADMQIPYRGITADDTLVMRLDEGEAWVKAANMPGDRIDIVRVLSHEAGHGLGILHLGSGNLMAPTISHIREPQQHDIREAVVRYGERRGSVPSSDVDFGECLSHLLDLLDGDSDLERELTQAWESAR